MTQLLFPVFSGICDAVPLSFEPFLFLFSFSWREGVAGNKSKTDSSWEKHRRYLEKEVSQCLPPLTTDVFVHR